MVAPSAPRDARSKTPPGPEGSNGIDRRGRRGQPAGSSPFLLWNSCADRRLFISAGRGDGIYPHHPGHIRPARQQRYRSTRVPRSAGGVIALSMLRIEIPRFAAQTLGPGYVLPIPAPSGRPLTKVALLRSTSGQLRSRRGFAIFPTTTRCGVFDSRRSALGVRPGFHARARPPRVGRGYTPTALDLANYIARSRPGASGCDPDVEDIQAAMHPMTAAVGGDVGVGG